jgi:preprotein translocase subunit SecD
MSIKLIGFFCFILCLISCTHQPKYEYFIEVTSESIESATIERLKQRLNAISSQVNIIKKNDQEISINFKSSAMDTLVQEVITTKGNLSFYEAKNLEETILVISELSKIFPSDTTESQHRFEDVFYTANYPQSAVIGYVKEEDTTTFNTLFIRPEIRSYLNEYPLHIKFAWGVPDSETGRLPLYALEVGTKKRPAMDGDIISNASASRTNIGTPSISISMEGLQAEKWERLTRRASEEGFPVAFVLDDVVIIAPNVSQTIHGGNAEISGNLNEREAFTLSVILNSGPIQPLEIIRMNKQIL